jgi:hypothetical protein
MFLGRRISGLALRVASLLVLVAILALSIQYHSGGFSLPTRIASIAKAKAFIVQDRTGIDQALKKGLENQLLNLHGSFPGFDQKQHVPNWLIVASHLIRSPPSAALT